MISTKRNGHVLPNTTRKPKIKREQAPTCEWQNCAGCGGNFFSVDGRSHCAMCRPTTVEEIAVRTCGAPGCTEIIGAELEYCQKHAEPLFADKAQSPAAGGEVLTSKLQTLNSSAPTQLTVPIGRIEPDPDQPRKEFDEVELAKLAKSLHDEGQLVPLIVNVVHGDLGKPRYRIIEGERRWRAAKMAGLTELRVEAHDLDREDVLRLQGIANLLRKDLNPIEEARWCKRMCQAVSEGGGGLTQEQLAERLGVTQAEVSNRIRVLRAPQWALDLVISGQMSRKHATALLQYEGAQAVLAAIEKHVKGDLKRDGYLPSAEEWQRTIHSIARNKTGSLEGSEWLSGSMNRVQFRIDPNALEKDQREAIGLIEVPNWNGEKELRAQNWKLAEKLLNQAKREAIAKAEKRGKAKSAGKNVEQELTPAEKKRREKERADQQRKRLGEWYHDWLRVLCAGRMTLGAIGKKQIDGVGWLALWAMLEQPESQYEAPRRFAELAGAKPRASFHGKTHEVLAALKPSQADEAMRKWTIGLLIDDEGNGRRHGGGLPFVYDDVVKTLAELIEIDVAAAWRDDRSSSMRERYWNLHDKDGLLALGKELGVPLADGKTKAAMVAILCGQQKPLAMPRELVSLAGKKLGARS